ncbi:MAG TPA: MFS transporter [Candidatus Saccharimonadales bacterium]|jgi:EmrB/QacA subfamily drug resistance transporter|nr:MFS transporter [Candidatus Saccharimonadales bacterium]
MNSHGIKKWLPLVVLALALFIIVLDSTIISVSIKAIIESLHSNLRAIQWVITGYSLTLAAFLITGGRLGDIFGRRRMFRIGAVIFAIGSLIASQAHSAPMLLLSVSLVEGFGAAMMMPSTTSLLVSTYHGKDRAIGFGVWGAIAGAAATIGPIVGGYLTSTYSWRWNYLINPIVALILLLGSKVIRESRDPHPHKPDFRSILLSALGLASLVYGLIESSTYGWVKAKLPYEFVGHYYHLLGISISSYAIIIGLLIIAWFVHRQSSLTRRDKFPLVSISLFKNRPFVYSIVTATILLMAQYGLVFILPVFYQGYLGKDAFHSGLAILPLSLGILLSAPLAGFLAGKKGIPQRVLIQVGLCLLIVGSLLLRQELTTAATIWTLLPGLAVFGLGFGPVVSQISNVILSAVPVEESGEAAGLNATSRQIGASFGQALIGALLIATLATRLNADVSQSRIIPPPLKPQITANVTATDESLGTSTISLSAKQLPPKINQEIMRIQGDAIVTGSRASLLLMTGILAIALVSSTLIPKRAAISQAVNPEEN